MNSAIEFKVSVKPDVGAIVRAFSGKNLTSFLKAQVNRTAAMVERYAKQLTPVKTGRLRASINFTPVSIMLQSIVSTKTDYAIFVHEGTKYMRGRPFMKYGAMFAQVNLDKDIAVKLDNEFVQGFKNGGFNK